jgi:hypothetical protein
MGTFVGFSLETPRQARREGPGTSVQKSFLPIFHSPRLMGDQA